MAKKGLDWFPLDVDFEDTSVEMIECLYGMIGQSVIITLWQYIYKNNGYYCNYDRRTALKLSRRYGVQLSVALPKSSKTPLEILDEIVNSAVQYGVFDSDLFKKYNILTSRGIQKRYLAGARLRKDVEIKTEYLLIDVPKKDGINVGNEKTNVKNAKTNVKNQQIRLDKIKLDKSREDKSSISASQSEPDSRTAKPEKHKYGEFKHVLLTDDEHERLCESYSNADELIQYLDEYIEMKGYKAKSHYLCIKKWVADAVKEKHLKAQKLREQERTETKSSNPFLELLRKGELGE